MKKFRVCITRETSESAYVEIEAKNSDAAEDKAFAIPVNELVFAADDWVSENHYVSDTEEIE